MSVYECERVCVCVCELLNDNHNKCFDKEVLEVFGYSISSCLLGSRLNLIYD